MVKQVEVFCTLRVDGIHNWPEVPFGEVDFLGDPHRHMFHITARKRVSHNDRDIEFIVLKHQIYEYLREQYYSREKRTHTFGRMSCEMIGQELMNRFDLSQVEVSEDGENGAVITKPPVESSSSDGAPL